MDTASPVETRRSLEAANMYAQSGIPFIPMPVLNPAQRDEAVDESMRRLEQMESES